MSTVSIQVCGNRCPSYASYNHAEPCRPPTKRQTDAVPAAHGNSPRNNTVPGSVRATWQHCDRINSVFKIFSWNFRSPGHRPNGHGGLRRFHGRFGFLVSGIGTYKIRNHDPLHPSTPSAKGLTRPTAAGHRGLRSSCVANQQLGTYNAYNSTIISVLVFLACLVLLLSDVSHVSKSIRASPTGISVSTTDKYNYLKFIAARVLALLLHIASSIARPLRVPATTVAVCAVADAASRLSRCHVVAHSPPDQRSSVSRRVLCATSPEIVIGRCGSTTFIVLITVSAKSHGGHGLDTVPSVAVRSR